VFFGSRKTLEWARFVFAFGFAMAALLPSHAGM